MTWTEKLQRVTDSDGIVLLLEMTAPSFGATLRLGNDTRDWISRGETFVGFPFRFTRPQDVAGVVPTARLEIDNVGREMTADLEGLQPNEIITAKVHLADRADPDSYFDTLPLPITRVSVTPAVVRADCGVDYIMRQAAVKRRYTPYTAPGIF